MCEIVDLSTEEYQCFVPAIGSDMLRYLPRRRGFFYNDDGVLMRRTNTLIKGHLRETTIRVCDGIAIVGQGRSACGRYWLYVQARDATGQWSDVRIPWSKTGTATALELIRDAGAFVPSEGEKHLLDLLANTSPKVIVALPEGVLEQEMTC